MSNIFNFKLTFLLFINLLFSVVHAQKKTIEKQINDRINIALISSSMTIGDMSKVEQDLQLALDGGLSINEIKEVIVQLYAYAGFPRSLNAISKLEEVLKSRKQMGTNDSVGVEPVILVIQSERKYDYGKDIQRELKGNDNLGDAQKFFPFIDKLIKEHLFTDIFSRGVLSYEQREVATISSLASLSGVENQLIQHLKIAKNIGLSKKELQKIISSILINIGTKQTEIALSAIETVMAEH